MVKDIFETIGESENLKKSRKIHKLDIVMKIILNNFKSVKELSLSTADETNQLLQLVFERVTSKGGKVVYENGKYNLYSQDGEHRGYLRVEYVPSPYLTKAAEALIAAVSQRKR